MKLRAYLLMLFVVAIWGSTFVVVKGALNDATPAAFNFIRMALSFIVLAVAYHRFWRTLTTWKIGAGAVVGFFLAMGYQFQTTGLARTTPSKSAFITGLLVVMVPFLSLIPGIRPPNAHPPRWNAFTGAVLAFIGILLLTAPATLAAKNAGAAAQLMALLPDLSTINPGDILTLGCALGFALHTLAISHTSGRVGFQQLAMLQIGFSALFMGLSLPLIETPHVQWTTRLIVALLIAAIFATALAFSVQTWVQSILPPTHMAVLFTMEPVFAWITSFLLLGERMSLRPGIGALLILAGILFTELFQQTPVPTAHEG